MKKWMLIPLAAATLVGAAESKFGIVNFASCMAESKFGKQEQVAFDEMKGKMESLITDIQGQLKDVTEKLQDPDYMDGLSPEGEHELKSKYQTLREEHDRYQSQFYQVMNQSNMQMVQKMQAYVSTASDKVAKVQDLDMIVTRDACFSFSTANDVTTQVVNEMDASFDKMQNENKAK
jgi:outer membrane protein